MACLPVVLPNTFERASPSLTVDIEIVWGAGEGKTELGAFDAALAAAGIHNYNHVELSSVIPPDATVTETGTHDEAWPVGTLLASVLAANRSTVAGETIAAGLGWAKADAGGVFFEATGGSTENVQSLLHRGIESAKEHRPSWEWEAGIESRVVDHQVESAGAVVVAALYRPIPD